MSVLFQGIFVNCGEQQIALCLIAAGSQPDASIFVTIRVFVIARAGCGNKIGILDPKFATISSHGEVAMLRKGYN